MKTLIDFEDLTSYALSAGKQKRFRNAKFCWGCDSP